MRATAPQPAYAARLALPDGIAFNVWHETLGESRVAAHGATAAASDADVTRLLCVGEPYYVECRRAPRCARRRRASSSSRRRGGAQLVQVPVRREDGRLELRLSSAEPGLPLPADVVLKVKHKALGVEVALRSSSRARRRGSTCSATTRCW